MANFENTLNVHDGAAVTNWISQINAGGTVYDIATHHSIKFVEGNEETTWNGLSDLTVVIPTIQDIVQTPIEFAGTVGADGNVVWNSTHTDGPQIGYLVFFTADCPKFGETEIACEAGDMAIYDGTKWNVVSGENQVKIVAPADATSGEAANTHTVAVGAAKNVLTVEGKTLALTLDYADLNNNHLTVGKTFGKDVSVEFGDVTVAGVGLKLNQGDATPTTIGTTTTVVEATALADGKVTLTNADSLVREVNFGTFTAGTLPEGKKNTQKTLTVTGGSVVKGAGSDFVTNVTFGNVTFEEAGEGDTNKITAITSVTGKQEGQEFYKGIHLTKENETADITIAGVYVPDSVTFVDGLADGKTSVLTGFTEGSFSFTTGAKEVVTGFDGSAEVIDTVTASVKSTKNVLNSAYVENNVLHFGNVDVASDVAVSTTTRNLQLTKTGYSYESAKATSSNLSTSGFTQAESVGYTFDKANETIYTTETGMWKLNTPQLGVDKGAYTLSNANMIATVEAGTFVESVSGGVLPEWKGYSAPTVKVEGTVGTALTTSEKSIIGLNDTKINMPGAYTLTSVEAGKGDVTVAAAGSDVVTIGESSVNLKGYLTDVTVTIA